MLNDILFALRLLRKSPGFTFTAVISLALGIGANTTIFSALNAVLLRSLPVRNPHELRLVNWAGRNPELNSYTGFGMSSAPGGLQKGTSFPYPAYLDFRDHGEGFTNAIAFFGINKGVTVVSRGEASVAGTMLVSGNYFAGYGVNVAIGRPIAPEDDRMGAAPVAVIAYRWWERHYGLDPGIVGESITLNQTSYTVIGVLPRNYVGPMMGDPEDIYVPMSAQPHLVPSRPLDSPNRWWVQIMGRIAPGANESRAQASLSVLFRHVLGESNSKMEQPGILLEDGSRGMMMLRRRLAAPFLALTVVTALVLLIACANLACLLLARGASRQHEMSVRAAIGAGRGRLIRQSLIESLILSLAGAALGLLAASWGKQVLLGLLTFIPDGFHFDLRTDRNVLLFTLGVSILTALIFGVLPALRASKADPLEGLKCQSAMGTPRLRLGKALVVFQTGLSVLLVFGAGLMIRTFTNLSQVNPGFDSGNVLLFRVDPGQAGYDGKRLSDFYDQIRAAIGNIPGAITVTFSAFPLASGSYSSEGIVFPDREKRPGEDWQAAVLAVGGGFFSTMSIPLLSGRDFNSNDNETGLPVSVVNATFARRFFPKENPVGRTFIMQDGTDRRIQIVGVCGDAKYSDVRADIPPLMYLSHRQRPQGGMTFETRSSLPPLSLAPAVRKALAAIDPSIPITAIKTQERQIEQAIAPDRLFAVLGGAFALLALLLSCVGLYGLMAYNVARRSKEIGVRMALGATRRNVAVPILREAGTLAGIGLAIGVPVAIATTGLIKSQLFGVAPADPATLIGTVVLLMSVALISAWIPARRAAKVDPMAALRSE